MFVYVSVCDTGVEYVRLHELCIVECGAINVLFNFFVTICFHLIHGLIALVGKYCLSLITLNAFQFLVQI